MPTPQITAEQILREAKELQEQDFKPPKQKITDEAELAEYRLRKRKEFEDLVRRVRWNASVWVKVAFHRLACMPAWACFSCCMQHFCRQIFTPLLLFLAALPKNCAHRWTHQCDGVVA